MPRFATCGARSSRDEQSALPAALGRCSIANPHSVPTPSRRHPPPATAHADSAGEEYVPVPEVSEVMEVVEADEVVKVMEVMVWNHHGMVVASPPAGHVWAAAAHTTSAVHTAHAMQA